MNDNSLFLGLSPHADAVKSLSNENLELLDKTVREILRKNELSAFQEITFDADPNTKETVDYLNRHILHKNINTHSERIILDLSEEDIEALYRCSQAIKDEKEKRQIISPLNNAGVDKIKIPAGWTLEEDEKGRAFLNRNGKVMFEFKHNWTNKYKYFKVMWENYGQKVDYKIVYEFRSKLIYPEKGVSKFNSNMRNTINKLRKEMKHLPIKIKTSKGFQLLIR